MKGNWRASSATRSQALARAEATFGGVRGLGAHLISLLSEDTVPRCFRLSVTAITP